LKLATIEIDKNPCLIFRINDELGVSIETLSKTFNLKLSWSSMQEFISSDSIMQQEIAHKIEKISQEPDQYNLIKLNKVTWLPPNPNTRKILGVAFNNKGIRKEAHFDPGCPNYFLKSSSCLNGHNEPVLIRDYYGNTIPEPELCLFIGNPGKDIKKEHALNHVFGYSIINDITSHGMKFSKDSLAVTRDQKIMRPEYTNWRKSYGSDENDLYFVYHTRSKNTDTFGPMGPWITTQDEIKDPNNLRIHAYKNNQCFTDDTTQSYTFSIEDLIVDASRYFTLEAGDIISCGTAAKGNENFPHAHRNVLLNEEECQIDISIEGLGTLSHSVKHIK
jgi:2-keto-4-pentenoate hydratase/2-oxohepta-3-ene-1,7-dioic acid hydratase in catechol pathway